MHSITDLSDSSCNDIWLHLIMAQSMGCNDHTKYITNLFIDKCTTKKTN